MVYSSTVLFHMFLLTDWVNDDLLSKLEKHPRLASQLSDPRFNQAMSMFQSNPQGAMKYFQDNPEIQSFFQDFCGILGRPGGCFSKTWIDFKLD